jgi:hypothetical protein
MIILLKASSVLMRRVVLVRNVGVSLVRCRYLWLPCCILFWVSCCDVLTRDFVYYFLSYIYLNVFGCVFIGSCYVFLMGFFHRSVLWRWCMCCWERCLSTVCMSSCVGVAKTVKLKLKLNSVASVHERTIPTERLPLVGEVNAKFWW